MSPIGNLQTEGDLERFIEDRGARQTQAFRAQLASVLQATQSSVLAGTFVTGEATTSNFLVPLATDSPTVTVVEAGSYVVLFGAEFTSGSSVTPAMSLRINGVVSMIPEHKQVMDTPTSSAQLNAFTALELAAGDVVGLAYRSQAAISVTFSNRRLALVRVSS